MFLQIAIYLPDLLFEAFPLLFMGACSIAGGFLAILLPETLGSNLCETMQDVEELGKDSKPFFAWWSTKDLKEHLEKQALKEKKEQYQEMD